MWNPSAVISVAVRSRWSSLRSYLDCLSWCDLVDYLEGHLLRSMVIFEHGRWPCVVMISRVFGILFETVAIRICTHLALIMPAWLVIYLWCIWRYTGRLAYGRWADCLRSVGALSGSGPGVHVDSSVAGFAITWLGAHMVVLYCHAGTSFLHFRYGSCLQ